MIHKSFLKSLDLYIGHIHYSGPKFISIFRLHVSFEEETFIHGLGQKFMNSLPSIFMLIVGTMLDRVCIHHLPALLQAEIRPALQCHAGIPLSLSALVSPTGLHLYCYLLYAQYVLSNFHSKLIIYKWTRPLGHTVYSIILTHIFIYLSQRWYGINWEPYFDLFLFLFYFSIYCSLSLSFLALELWK